MPNKLHEIVFEFNVHRPGRGGTYTIFRPTYVLTYEKDTTPGSRRLLYREQHWSTLLMIAERVIDITRGVWLKDRKDDSCQQRHLSRRELAVWRDTPWMDIEDIFKELLADGTLRLVDSGLCPWW